jgi:hypothetical protein
VDRWGWNASSLYLGDQEVADRTVPPQAGGGRAYTSPGVLAAINRRPVTTTP